MPPDSAGSKGLVGVLPSEWDQSDISGIRGLSAVRFRLTFSCMVDRKACSTEGLKQMLDLWDHSPRR